MRGEVLFLVLLAGSPLFLDFLLFRCDGRRGRRRRIVRRDRTWRRRCRDRRWEWKHNRACARSLEANGVLTKSGMMVVSPVAKRAEHNIVRVRTMIDLDARMTPARPVQVCFHTSEIWILGENAGGFNWCHGTKRRFRIGYPVVDHSYPPQPVWREPFAWFDGIQRSVKNWLVRKQMDVAYEDKRKFHTPIMFADVPMTVRVGQHMGNVVWQWWNGIPSPDFQSVPCYSIE